jgi:hypothetical protein
MRSLFARTFAARTFRARTLRGPTPEEKQPENNSEKGPARSKQRYDIGVQTDWLASTAAVLLLEDIEPV